MNHVLIEWLYIYIYDTYEMCVYSLFYTSYYHVFLFWWKRFLTCVVWLAEFCRSTKIMTN